MTADTTTPHPCAAALAAQMAARGISTQRHLARDLEAAGLKMAQSTLSLALSGRTPDLSTVRKLASFFGVPATIFMPELAELVPTSGDPRIKRFPLGALVLAKGNERTTFLTAAIDDLARQIIEAGTLYQNLVGYPEGAAVAIWDGGRRLRALARCREWGQLPPALEEYGIPVLLLEDRVACMTATIAANQKEDTHFLDRAAALARLQDETGWKAPRLARETGLGSERLIQQLLQIHRNLPDWARERAFLPKDDPQHLKFRDCRDLVEAPRTPAPGAAAAASTGKEEGGEVPLPLAMPAPEAAAPPAQTTAATAAEPPPVKFTKEQVKEAFATFLQAAPRPAETPVADRVIAAVKGRSEWLDIGRDTLLSDALSEKGMAALAADLAEEFGVVLQADDVDAAKTVAGLVRAVINAPKAAPQKPQETTQENPHHLAVGGRIGHAWVLHAVQLKLCDRPIAIELKNLNTGQIVLFVPEQHDIEEA